MAEEKKQDKRDEENEGAEQTQPAGGSGSKKKALIILGAVVGSLLLIGTPLYFLGTRSGGDDKEASDAIVTPPAESAAEGEEASYAEGHEDEIEVTDDEEPLGAVYPLESYVVNLSSKDNFLRCQIQIEFQGLDVPPSFYAKLVPMQENIIRILTSRKPEEVLSWDGKEELKNEIKTMINETLRKELVRNVYFTQFVVQ